MAASSFKLGPLRVLRFQFPAPLYFNVVCLVSLLVAQGCEGGVVVGGHEVEKSEASGVEGAALPIVSLRSADHVMGSHIALLSAPQFDNQITGEDVGRNMGPWEEELQVSWSTTSQTSVLFLPLLAVFFAFILSIVILIWIRRQMSGSEKEGDEGRRDKSEAGAQWICHPVIKPLTKEDTQPLQSSRPTDIESGRKSRAKGLLERRGSSASLTIELVHPEPITPTKECTTEEYLRCVSKVLSRHELRTCLRDVRALHREFWDLPLNHPDRVQVPGSWSKNRYRTVIPNEKTRVNLPSPSSPNSPGGYINANYIRGYGGEGKVFIATQGPMTHTVNDFWYMVWAESAPVIVMITKLWEKSKSKCESYLPSDPDLPLIFGPVTVTVLAIQHKDGYTIRTIQMQKQEVTRKVVHFWFDSWLDHRTPPNAHSLLSMVKEVELARVEGWKGSLRSPPSVKDSTSPVLNLGKLELEEESSWSGPFEEGKAEAVSSSEGARRQVAHLGGGGGASFGSVPHIRAQPTSATSTEERRMDFEGRSKSEDSASDNSTLLFKFERLSAGHSLREDSVDSPPERRISPRWLELQPKIAAGPVVVHCSAGIGRTGSFIALSIAVNQLLAENQVDVLGIVAQIRCDRGGLVQTAEQYEFIHRALVLFERSLPDQSGE